MRCKPLGRGPQLFRRTSGGTRPRPQNESPLTRHRCDDRLRAHEPERATHAHTRDVLERPSERAATHNARRNAKTRRSVVTNSLFGLGAPELVVILGLGAFVLGPDKLASMAKDFGKVAGELKDVPKEFKEGLEEGEAAKAARILESGEKEEESA